MSEGPSLEGAGLLADITDAMVTESVASREYEPDAGDPEGLEAAQPSIDWRAVISPVGYEFVCRWETGGQAYYEKNVKGRPIWPGYASGITIGCGFDLGYHTEAVFRAEWGLRIKPADLERLAKTLGFRTVEPHRAEKVAQAKAWVEELSDISVPWALAIDHFETTKLPKLVKQLYGALDNLDRLHKHCRAALLSLMFNRGNSFRAAGERYKEMRAIGAAMTEGTTAAFARIPTHLRDMVRIWGPESSLSKRRLGEADLFELGLKEPAQQGLEMARVNAADALDPGGASDDLRDILDAWKGQRSKGALRFTVTTKRDADPETLAAQVRALTGLDANARQLFHNEPELSRFILITIPSVATPDRDDLFEVAAFLRRRLGAETVEPDLGTDYFMCECDEPPSGTVESLDFARWCWVDPVKDKPKDENWALAVTRVKEAWDFAERSDRPAKGEGVRIFQLDTGVVPQHAEIPPEAHMHPSAFNLIERGKPPIDPMASGLNPGHGTGTGSVVASPEGGQMSGSAPRATLIPARCIETVAVIDQSPVAEAIVEATRRSAHVITMSLGGVMSTALHAAVRKAVRSNVIVVAAAGNCVGEVVWPARYSEVIAIGGINEKLAPWKGSCRGPDVDISAPAELVLRANFRKDDARFDSVGGGQGTSFATALTAGTAALWLAFHGRDRLISMLPADATLQTMFKRLLALSAQRPPGHDTENYGAGLVDARKLLEMDPLDAFRDGPLPAGLDNTSLLGSLVSLVERAFGRGGVEAATVATDPQFAPEIACAALDRIRARNTRRASVESLPPPMLSPALRRKLSAIASHRRGEMG